MKLIVCGSREWRNKEEIKRIFSILKDQIGTFTIIEGENGKIHPITGKVIVGADKFAKEVGIELDLPIEEYPYLSQYGRAGGPMRNAQMIREGHPNGVIAFHGDLMKSRGTRDMVNQAQKAGLPVWVWTNGQEAFEKFILQLTSQKITKEK